MPSRLFPHPLDVYIIDQDQKDTGLVDTDPQGSPVLTAIDCNVQPMTAEESEDYQRKGIVANVKIFSAYDFGTLTVGTPPNQTIGLSSGFAMKDASTGEWYNIVGVERRSNPFFQRPLQYKIIGFKRIV